jgi:hypothetical protein
MHKYGVAICPALAAVGGAVALIAAAHNQVIKHILKSLKGNNFLFLR